MPIKKIVVAEDDDAIAHMVTMALGDAGFLCLRARDGDEALQLVRLHNPDALVLDIMMPRVDGIEVAKRLKSDVMLSRIPILMLTALGSVDEKVGGFEAGADAYMVKPFDLRELSARVRALLRSSQRERERNPTTGLPSSSAIEAEISEILATGADAVVVQFAINDFNTYAERVGYSRAEELVKSVGQLVLNQTRIYSEGEVFVGHLGGVDFMSVTQREFGEELAKTIVQLYEIQREAWLVSAGDDAPEPDMSMFAGVVTTEGLGAGDNEKLAKRLAAAMKGAKAKGRSTHFVWKPPPA